MWTPNNKTIITLEPIEIPFSFLLRCWSIWRGVYEYVGVYVGVYEVLLTRKKLGSSVWLGGGGPRSKGAPNYNFLNFCLSDFTLRDSKDLAFTSILIPRSSKSDHDNLWCGHWKILGQPGVPKFWGALKWARWAPRSENWHLMFYRGFKHLHK